MNILSEIWKIIFSCPLSCLCRQFSF